MTQCLHILYIYVLRNGRISAYNKYIYQLNRYFLIVFNINIWYLLSLNMVLYWCGLGYVPFVSVSEYSNIKVEDTKGIIRSRKSKRKRTKWQSLAQKTKDRATWTSSKAGELRKGKQFLLHMCHQSLISWREQINFQWYDDDDDEVHFVQDQHV
jgi:hypothetical protein